MIGQTISHYRIIEKLGQGGMGSVYLAEDTLLARRVAIKFLSSLDQHYRVRFLREARAVSALSHPNIAAVFDYGETVDGQPYIVMELVKGSTLGELLEAESLSLARSIEVVSAIAAALGEAHHQGVIHRDITPNNVVVNERGQVKVLDFGLVKHLPEASGDVVDQSAATMSFASTLSDVIVGTPLYLSPEQATGKPVDGRSDLFALGALLYECLAGRSAFSGSSVLEIGAQVIHVNPPAPSKSNPRVPLELDRITLKALEKRVEARYQTAEEMIADLQSVSANLTSDDLYTPGPASRSTSPATALPTSPLTTLTTTFRRPRLSLATFLIGILVVGVAIWGLLHFWKPGAYQSSGVALDWYNKGTDALRNGAFLQASKALEQAVAADDKFALAHARLAEAWTELDYTAKAKDELLRVSSLVPDRSRLPRIDALYLEAVNATVTREFPEAIKAYSEIVKQKPNDAQVYVDLGRAYEKNNDVDQAIANYVKATNLDGQYATAYLRAGVGYSRKLDVAGASSAFDKADALFKALGNAEGVAEVFRQRGILFSGMGRFADARSQFQQAMDTARATGNEPQQIQLLIELSYLSFTEGETAQAHEYARQALDFARQKRLENLTTGGLIELGNSFAGRGDYDEAEKYYKEALDLARTNNGRRREATALMNLGGLYIQQLRTGEGLPLVQEALNFFQQGNYPRNVLICLSFIGRANRQRGNYDEALKALQQKLQLARQGGDQSQIAFSYGEIGSVMTELERYPEALKQYNDSYEINKALGNQLQLAYNLHNRGNVLWRLGRYQDARKSLAESFAIASQPKSDYKALRAEIELSNAQIALSEQRFPAARAKAEQALQLAGTQYKQVAIEARCIAGLAKVFLGNKEGIGNCEEAVQMATAAGEAGLISRTKLGLGIAALEGGDTQKALEAANEARERFAAAGQKESEWRALVVAARANELQGNANAGREQRSAAASTLEQLRQAWGDYVNSYLARRDIQVFRKQLG